MKVNDRNDVPRITKELCDNCEHNKHVQDLNYYHCSQISTYAFRDEHGVMFPVERCPKLPYEGASIPKEPPTRKEKHFEKLEKKLDKQLIISIAFLLLFSGFSIGFGVGFIVFGGLN